MMIDDDDIKSEPARFGKRLVACGAAIDGDQQFSATLGECADRFNIRAIALEDAVGDVNHRIEAASAQEARKQRG